MGRKVLFFVVLTFALSHTLAFAFEVLGGKWNTPEAYIMATGYMFVPMAVAVALQKLSGEPVRGPSGYASGRTCGGS